MRQVDRPAGRDHRRDDVKTSAATDIDVYPPSAAALVIPVLVERNSTVGQHARYRHVTFVAKFNTSFDRGFSLKSGGALLHARSTKGAFVDSAIESSAPATGRVEFSYPFSAVLARSPWRIVSHRLRTCAGAHLV